MSTVIASETSQSRESQDVLTEIRTLTLLTPGPLKRETHSTNLVVRTVRFPF